MFQKLKVGACCVALCVVMATQTNAAETAAEKTSAFDPMADKVLRSADAYLKSQKSLAVKAETLRDIVTDDGQIITFTTQIELSLERPNKMYAKRVGVIRNQEIFYNGSQLVLHSLNHNVYAMKQQVPPTISQMMDFATGQLGLQVPGSDLLYKDLYDGMMSGAVSGLYLGKVVVDDVECHHLAYRGDESDFQLWIEAGNEAKPKRFMIVSKLMAAAPRYMINIASMEHAEFTNETFDFTPQVGEKRIRFLTEEEIEQVKEAVKESK
ncbi:MAG: DUF2092 domain-containing protein [Deltaproteobacteria bacterium]|nr:DUF2092 domain-containing protein [Deltaproteobacteria bacterium]